MTRRKDMEGAIRFWAMAREWLQAYLSKVRRASPKTVEAYRSSFECLIGYLENERVMTREMIGFGTLDRTTVKAWIAWMNGERGYCAVRPPKVAKKPVGYLKPEETRTLLAAYSGRTAKERRNRAMPALHCHLIRKARAMDLCQASVPLPLVAQLLGHESISTTKVYRPRRGSTRSRPTA